MVEVDSGDGADDVVVRRRRADYAEVVADPRSEPVEGAVLGIGDNGLLPCLEGDVSAPNPGVLEHQAGVHRHILAPVSELVSVVQELPLPDVAGFGIGEADMGGDGEDGVIRGAAEREEGEMCEEKREEVGLPHLNRDI